jgi:hypothetical protein
LCAGPSAKIKKVFLSYREEGRNKEEETRNKEQGTRKKEEGRRNKEQGTGL